MSVNAYNSSRRAQNQAVLIAYVWVCLALTTGATRRKRRRTYLTRPSLLNPRIESPWMKLFASGNDRSMIATTGLDYRSFHRILDGGFRERFNNDTLRRNDVALHGTPRLGGRSLPAEGCLSLCLTWLSSSMSEQSLQQIFGLVPSNCSR